MQESLAQHSRNVLLTHPRYADRKHLVPFGRKVYSQTDEDGIISEIFNRIGTTNKVFVEFGVGNGLENNTLALLFQDWTGLWIEGSKKYAQLIRSNLPRMIGSGRLALINEFITQDNINSLISSAISETSIDLLSVDIDGNDFHVLNAIDCIEPRVIVMEYNAKFAPPIQYCMTYDAAHAWGGDDNYGVSLKFLEIELDKRGYSLVGCNMTGTNSFFVKRELAADNFLMPYSAEIHYEPPRFYLASITSGHTSSYKALENAWLER